MAIGGAECGGQNAKTNTITRITEAPLTAGSGSTRTAQNLVMSHLLWSVSHSLS
jgi:hypothetical protein